MSKKQVKTPSKKQEQDDTTQKLSFGYRKQCNNYSIIVNPGIKAKLDEAVEHNKYQILHSTEQLGPMHVRAIMQVASDLHYEKLKKIRIWKGNVGDEGVRFICKFIDTTYSLEFLDLMDNGITALGCQFFGKTLISPQCKLTLLKLDNNNIGSLGLKYLALGLRQNNVIDKLSLKYCGIDGEGSRYVQQILANISSKLRSLKLQGNSIGNEGVYQILRAIQCSQSLQKINLADTNMSLLTYQEGRQSIVEHISDQLELLMKKNILIIKYDIRFNPMNDHIAVKLLKAIQQNPKILKMEFAGNVSYQMRDALDTILRKRNKTKKGKLRKSPKKSKK